MSSNKSTRDRTKDRDRERNLNIKKEKERKESDRKDRKSSRENEKERSERKSGSREKHKEKEKRADKESERKRSKGKEKDESDRRKSESRSKDKKDSSREERRSSKSFVRDKPHVEHHLIEDLIDDDGDLVESEISEENIKPPSRISQIQSAKIKDDKEELIKEEEYNYDDDDFEEYDEDFEDEDEEEDEEEEESEDTEEDDNLAVEKKLDSGNYDVQVPKHSSLRMQKELEAVKEAMKRENSGVRTKTKKENSDDSGRESPVPVARPERKQSGFINFSAAKERNKVQIAAAAATSRGSELLQMIRLDIVNFDLLDLPPIRYEAFMKTFGSSNSQQSSSQTGDDNLEVEVQTEEMPSVNKWTQKPPTFGQKVDMEDVRAVRTNLLGVGGDTTVEEEELQYNQTSTGLRLSKFICGAGQALLGVLEEDSARREGEQVEGLPQRDIDFADSITVLKIADIPYLEGLSVTLVEFSPESPLTLVTVHGREEKACYVCLWNVARPQAPSHVFRSSGQVSSICTMGSLVFGGSVQGDVMAWDSRESLSSHHQVLDINNHLARSPTYANSEVHESKITAIKPLPSGHSDFELETFSVQNGLSAFQIVTLELEGKVVIWTILDYQKDYEQHLGLAHWGQVRMVASNTIQLANLTASDHLEQLEYHGHDINMDPLDVSRFYVASDGGTILHGSLQADHRPSPRVFKSEIETASSCTSLAFCPYDESFMLVGSEDGSIRLHSTSNDRPLITWAGTVDNEPILKVIWSSSRPCVFFILDTDNRIHLWDLGAGDIYPAHTVQFGDQVNSFSLSCENGEPGMRQMLAIGLEDGRVEVMHLKVEYRVEDEESCDRELERFLHYVSII